MSPTLIHPFGPHLGPQERRWACQALRQAEAGQAKPVEDGARAETED